MTNKDILEKVLRLTEELVSTNVARKIFDAVETEDAEKVKKVLETFEKENPTLYNDIIAFAESYNKTVIESKIESKSDEEVRIFGDEDSENRGIITFDSQKIDALSLYALCLIGKINELDLFGDWEGDTPLKFIEAISAAGYDWLADFVNSYNVNDWIGEEEEYSYFYEVLIDAFNGNFEDHDEDD